MKRKSSPRQIDPIPDGETFATIEPRRVIFAKAKPANGIALKPPLDSEESFGIIDLGEPIYRAKTPAAALLYLIFHTDPHADSVRLALALLEVMTAVTRLDRKQGGDGFTQTVHDQRHDRIVLALTPERRDVERIAKVAAAVNRKRGIRLPAELTEIRAVVS